MAGLDDEAPLTQNALPSKLILFDGVCVLCNGSMRFVMKHERAAVFHFAAIQSDAGQKVLADHGQETEDWDSVVVIEEGRVYRKSDAAVRIARYLRAPWRWLGIIRILPRGLRDWLYDRVARSRYRLFGRYEVCMVPTPEQRGRFLA
ncbi:thiol-disulfide oxidoreductase DCC family protein [Pelagibius sp.]|uniref:thiol-disulfide oxidoreductase DCC family protein n=1 Tax=Pelagibius sp. TaxID=1931238 RepID=UPI003BAE2FE4